MHNLVARYPVGNHGAARVLGIDEGLVGRVVRDVVGDERAEVRQPPAGGDDIVERVPSVALFLICGPVLKMPYLPTSTLDYSVQS